jgi:hypothetical protein
VASDCIFFYLTNQVEGGEGGLATFPSGVDVTKKTIAATSISLRSNQNCNTPFLLHPPKGTVLLDFFYLRFSFALFFRDIRGDSDVVVENWSLLALTLFIIWRH